jgi:acetyl esterase/lipase
MKRLPLALILGATCLVALPAVLMARTSLRERLSDMSGSEELAYGAHSLQKLDYWRPNKPGSPLVLFVHGGGWKRGDKRHAAELKAAHFLEQGYGFASINYRLVPDCTVEDQARDVASALAFLINRADSLGFDKTRIVLMGHSAGAHLSALIGTDMSYLKNAGLGPRSLRGVIPLDGACYDVPFQITLGAGIMHDTYLQAFGVERERQLALSPLHHAAAPNAPAFLILHVSRMDGILQSRLLGEALKKAGAKAEVRGFQGSGLQGHAEINRRLGDPSYPATPVVDEWLKQVF